MRVPVTALEQQIAHKIKPQPAQRRILAFGLGHRQPNIGAVAIHGLVDVWRHVGAVDREVRHDFTDGMDQAVEREIARTTVPLRELIQLMAEHIHFAGHRHPHDQLLVLIDKVLKGYAVANDTGVESVETLLVRSVDEEAVQKIEKVIPGGSMNRPLRGERLAATENLFHDQIERQPSGLVVGRQFGACPRLYLLQIVFRIVEPVYMIDAKAGDGALFEEAKDQLMGFVEDRRIFHADGDEIVDVEKTAVIDLFRGDTPVRQAVGLIIEEIVEKVEASRLAFRPVKTLDILLDEFRDGGAVSHDRRQPLLDDFIFAVTLKHALGTAFIRARQMSQGGNDALQFHDMGVMSASKLYQVIQSVRQDPQIGSRCDRQGVIVIPHCKGAVLIRKRDLLILEHEPVEIAQDRQQDFIVQFSLERVPVNVKECRVGGAGSILQDGTPPGIERMRNAHMIGDDVQD